MMIVLTNLKGVSTYPFEKPILLQFRCGGCEVEHELEAGVHLTNEQAIALSDNLRRVVENQDKTPPKHECFVIG